MNERSSGRRAWAGAGGARGEAWARAGMVRLTDGDDVDFGRCSATLNDGENTIAAKFAATCGEKLSSGAEK